MVSTLCRQLYLFKDTPPDNDDNDDDNDDNDLKKTAEVRGAEMNAVLWLKVLSTKTLRDRVSICTSATETVSKLSSPRRRSHGLHWVHVHPPGRRNFFLGQIYRRKL